jgi:hypothetical protein
LIIETIELDVSGIFPEIYYFSDLSYRKRVPSSANPLRTHSSLFGGQEINMESEFVGL